MTLKFNSYKEMPIRVFLTIRDILVDEDTDDMDKQFKIIAALMDISYDELQEYQLNDIKTVYESVNFLTKEMEIDKNKRYNKITLGNNKYTVTKNINNLSVAQYIDFQTYIKEKQYNIAEVLSVFIIPNGKKYNDGYDIADVINDIYSNMDIVTANEMLLFFIKTLANSIKRSLRYLEVSAMVMTKSMKTKYQIADRVAKMERQHGYLLSMLYQK